MVRFPILTFAVRSKQVVCQVVEILRQVDVKFQKGILDNKKKKKDQIQCILAIIGS